MIIRARLKPVEDVDPQLICCDGLRRNLEAYGGTEVEIYPDFYHATRYCSFCGKIKVLIGARLVTPVEGFQKVFLEYCDLDEGSVN